ncbi:MAG TPA: NnrS family protein [Polyangiaceae bacterium]|nr:NnrS family protein [Polyangiaceae bacterium]
MSQSPLHVGSFQPGKPVIPASDLIRSIEQRRGVALFAKGFRPLFLCAAVYAVLAVPLFLLELDGYVRAGAYLPPMYWHAHEMVFGFTGAVLGGFLLTAVANWTGRATAEGGALALLVVLWIAGRAGMLVPEHLPRYLPAFLDLSFLPALLIACARPILKTRNRRNYGFLAILGALFTANASIHAAALGAISSAWEHRGNLVAVDVLVVALVVMTGRVVPLFTRNALGAEDVRAHPVFERLAAAAVVALALVDVFDAPLAATGTVCALGALFTACRMRSWGSARALRAPLLWILHAGSLWIVAGLALRAAAACSSIPFASGLHALTAGALGSLTLGMMTRVGLGHTGRLLAVPRRIAFAFAAVLFGAVARVLAPVLWPGALGPLAVAGVVWSGAFAIYLATYAPVLVAPRVDGKPG